jgi:hypothetical protein
MAIEELVPLVMRTEVGHIRGSSWIECLYVVWISTKEIQKTAEKTALFVTPAKSTSSSSVVRLIPHGGYKQVCLKYKEPVYCLPVLDFLLICGSFDFLSCKFVISISAGFSKY